MKADLKGFDDRETEDWAVSRGLKPYQGRQIRRWLFKRLAGSFEEMTDILKPVIPALLIKMDFCLLPAEKRISL